MVHIFVDTNFFLQHKKYDQILWSELFQEDILIIIPRTVVSEIDKHKSSGNNRLSRKAKSFTALLRDIRDAPKIFQVGNINGSISIMENLNFVTPRKPFLNLTKADDCILNEILCWQEQNVGKRICVLSGDINLTLRCQDCDIPYKDIPDGWRLSFQADPRDREIENLKKIVEKTPKIEIITSDNDIVVEIPIYARLTDNEVDVLSKLLFKLFPMQNDFQKEQDENSHLFSRQQSFNNALNAFHSTLIYPTKNEIIEYKKNYEQWQSESVEKIKNSHIKIKNSKVVFDYELELFNSGNSPAYDLEIIVEVAGGILLLPVNAEESNCLWGYENLEISFPPEAPRARKRGCAVTSAFDSPQNIPIIPRDRVVPSYKPNTFYFRKNYREPSSSWRLFCTELRHKVEKHPFSMKLMIPEGYSRDTIAIKMTISAANITDPINKNIIFRQNLTQSSIADRIAQHIVSMSKPKDKE